MYTQPSAVKLDSTTNEMYGRYQQNPYHQRLPQPPRVLKNRYIDQTRHRVRRSNDEYGQFWNQVEEESSPGDRNFNPAGLTSGESNRHALPLNRALTDRKGAESRAFWHEPWQDPEDDRNTVLNNPLVSERRLDRKHFDIETLHPQTPAPYRAPRTPYREPPAPYRAPPASSKEPLAATYRVQPAPLPPIARNAAPMEHERSEQGGSRDVDDLERFIDRYKLHVGIENMGLGTSVHAPDIRYIDLRLHLKDNSSLTIKAVPFSFH